MPKTILFLHRGGNQIRGTEEALLTLLRGLDCSRFEPIVFYSSPAMGEAVAALGVEGYLQEFPELVLIPSEQSLPLGRYARAFRRLSRFCRTRGVDLIFCNGGLPCQLGVPLSKWLGKPLVCLYHHPAPKEYYRLWMLGRVPRMVFNSRFTAEHVRDRIEKDGDVVYVGVDAETTYLPPAVRDPRLRASLGIEPDEVVFAQVGALVGHKEHGVAIDAFASILPELPRARLVIIGTGSDAGRIATLVQERGLTDRVILTGYVDEITPYFHHLIDVHVLPSREEGLGLVNLQASACRIPNIGADGTGIRESIIHGETGYLFPLGDVEALGGYMLELGRDRGLRATLGARGRDFVLERFSSRGYCTRLQQVMEEAMRGGRGRLAPVEAMAPSEA